MSENLAAARVMHISAWARTFTQFRMPLIRRLNGAFREQVICCPWEPEHFDRLLREHATLREFELSQKFELSLFRQIWNLYRLLKRERFDVLIAHQPMGALVGIPAAWFARVPVIIYSTGGLKYVAGQKGLFNSLMKFGEYILIGMSDAVFLVNREDESTVRGMGKSKGKSFFVGPRGGCGIDTTRFNPRVRTANRKKAREELGAETDTFLVGYSGRCVWEKGFRELVEAAHLLREGARGSNFRFMVMGEGRHVSEIEAYARERAVDAAFEFLGYKFHGEYYLSAMDAFVLPSYREGMPVSLLEAMAMGISCIATNIRGNRELIEDGKTGLLIPARSAEKLAEAIRFMQENPDRAVEMGENASRCVMTYHSEDILLERTANIIFEVAGRTLRARGLPQGKGENTSFRE